MIKRHFKAYLGGLILFGSTYHAVAGCNLANGNNLTLAVNGPAYILPGSTNQYTLSGTGNQSGICSWTASNFTVPGGNSISSITSTIIALIAPSSLSSSIGDFSVSCSFIPSGTTVLSGDCTDDLAITIYTFTVDVPPNCTDSTIEVIDTLDSDSFAVTFTPSNVPAAVQWLSGSANGAWPTGAGRNPCLNYSNPTGRVTTVTNAWWFAVPNSRDIMSTGNNCYYGIGVEVTVENQTMQLAPAALLDVTVPLGGDCIPPAFTNWQSIPLAKNQNGIWHATGQGSFSRTAPVAVVTNILPATSAFYSKAETHENEHVDQYLNQSPWKDFYDANALYTNSITQITATSELALRVLINHAVQQKLVNDIQTDLQTELQAERGAFNAMNQVPPDYLEYVNESDWRQVYGL